MRRLLFAITLMLAALAPVAANAQTIESALMPGAVIKRHAEVEHECGKCHARGERAAQPALCLDCHKPVAADIKAGRGYHGRQKDTTCRGCHTEHRGRDAKIVRLDTRTFDHAQTDFLLKGKHTGRQCASCHKPGEAWSKAPSECAACHRKDDKHKGGLGEKCATCHNDGDWKDARFDHGKTKFPLKLAHADVKCADCHQNQRYTSTARECASCHRKDDTHKGHFGAACEKCHNEDKWKQPTFRHERDTSFALLDKHRPVKCDSCHRAPLYREKTSTRCASCHRGDDAHKGSLGDKCDKCHAAKGWKETRFDHDTDTKFPLKEKHGKATCQSCHTESKDGKPPAGKQDRTRRPTPTNCYACHEKDDREKGHKGNFGEKCESCHNERGFKFARFDHDRETRFKLANKHLAAKCESCHRKPLYSEKTETRCLSCHDKDDRDKGHKGRFGEKCESCHNDKSFKEGRFDHDRETEFRLLNKHLKARCDSCHKTPLYSTKTEKRCASCHDKDDVHFASYGTDCERCHVADDWRKIINQNKDGKEKKP